MNTPQTWQLTPESSPEQGCDVFLKIHVYTVTHISRVITVGVSHLHCALIDLQMSAMLFKFSVFLTWGDPRISLRQKVWHLIKIIVNVSGWGWIINENFRS